MSQKPRRHFSEEQKRAILKRHLVDKVPISDVCDQYELNPATFYDWQRRLFEGTLADQRTVGKPSDGTKELERKVTKLEEKLAKKDAVISEITQEYVTLKKELGEP